MPNGVRFALLRRTTQGIASIMVAGQRLAQLQTKAKKRRTRNSQSHGCRLRGIPVLPARAMLMEVAAIKAVVVAGPLAEEEWIGQ